MFLTESVFLPTDNLINNVKYKVEEFTGMEIEKSTSWLKAFASSTDGNRRNEESGYKYN